MTSKETSPMQVIIASLANTGCHALFQFMPKLNKLSEQCNQRSIRYEAVIALDSDGYFFASYQAPRCVGIKNGKPELITSVVSSQGFLNINDLYRHCNIDPSISLICLN